MQALRVFIADSCGLFCEGLKKILSSEKDFLVVGEAASGIEITKAVERFRPDVVLLDTEMPGATPVQIVVEIQEKKPGTKVLILTDSAAEDQSLDAAKAGAKGYAVKHISSQTLKQAIRTVHRGEIWVDGNLPWAQTFVELARERSADNGNESQNDTIHHLTKREVEILKLVANGLTNREIGKKVFISEKTVKTHLNHIFDKLKVNNRFKAALLVMNRSEGASSPSAKLQNRNNKH
jgi:DNA-binding NarL/FixJ family response regulator